jgi:hypothetical protein
MTEAFLLRLAAGNGGEPAAEVPDPDAAERLIAAAVREGLGGLLFAQSRAPGWRAWLPEHASQRLQSIYYLTVQTNLRYLAVLREIASQDVPFVLMQGGSLLLSIYADPGLRPVSDLDLWVQPQDHAQLTSMLRRLGFGENPLVPGVFRRGATLVDVHTHLHWAERIRSSRFLFTDNAGGLFHRCATRAWEGAQVRCLEPHDQAVYLLVHALKHNLERLMWLADVNRLVAGWGARDWDMFRGRAQELGQERVSAIFAYLRRVLFGLATPVQAMSGLGVGPVARFLLRMRRQGPLPKWSSLVLLSTGSPARQIRFALESTFPRPEVLRQVIPRSETMPVRRLYGLRFKQMAGMLR